MDDGGPRHGNQESYDIGGPLVYVNHPRALPYVPVEDMVESNVNKATPASQCVCMIP